VEHSRTYFDLVEACAQPGCPVCRVVLDAVDHYIDSLNYEFANDPAVRAKIEASWAFCNLHAQQWLTSAHPLGTAQIYGAVIRRISKEIEHAKPNPRPKILSSIAGRVGRPKNGDVSETGSSLGFPGTCSLCDYRKDHERMVTSVLLFGLKKPEFAIAYDQSIGLCVPHLRTVMLANSDQATFELLRNHALDVEQRLSAQLKEIIRKHDYRYQDEPSGEERGATERAVRHVAGAVGIVDRS
jgi:hypothetical protein